MPTLTFTDQSLTGNHTPAVTLTFPSEQITVRDLIRERVYQEVQDRNQGKSPTNTLISPGPIEAALNQPLPKTIKQIDWRPQFEKACDAFTANRFMVLIDNHQAESLDQTFTLHRATITFLKLTPLVGG
jgi:hypothetical protein